MNFDAYLGDDVMRNASKSSTAALDDCIAARQCGVVSSLQLRDLSMQGRNSVTLLFKEVDTVPAGKG